MTKLLIVEDDVNLREALALFFIRKQFTVVQAANGKIACDMLQTETFDVIVSDVKMPAMNGVALLKWTKANKPTPFILMTGFSDLLQAQEAYEIGADEFLTKPFSVADLFAVVKKVTASKPAGAPGEDFDSKYTKISIVDFIASPRVQVDVHMRLSPAKYLKIATAGSILLPDQIQFFRERGLDFVYVSNADAEKIRKK